MSRYTKETVDSKGRLVRLTKAPDGSVVQTYYIGRDCEGVIQVEGAQEYVDVDGEKRYWGGIIDPLPSSPKLESLSDFTVFVIKPDGMSIELGCAVAHLIELYGGKVISERDFTFTDTMVRKMYPHFFARTWEQELFDYLKSGVSRCFLVGGEYPHRRMFTLRNAIRHLFDRDHGPQVRSLIHCAQRQSDAIRQALLLYSLEELVALVGVRR